MVLRGTFNGASHGPSFLALKGLGVPHQLGFERCLKSLINNRIRRDAGGERGSVDGPLRTGDRVLDQSVTYICPSGAGIADDVAGLGHFKKGLRYTFEAPFFKARKVHNRADAELETANGVAVRTAGNEEQAKQSRAVAQRLDLLAVPILLVHLAVAHLLPRPLHDAPRDAIKSMNQNLSTLRRST